MKYNGSMEQIGKAIREYSDVAGLDTIRFFELALTLNGKKSNLKRGDFECFGASLKLSEVQIRKAVTNLTAALNNALPCALKNSFLPQPVQEQIGELIRQQMLKL